VIDTYKIADIHSQKRYGCGYIRPIGLQRLNWLCMAGKSVRHYLA